jgi:hypothetical protein
VVKEASTEELLIARLEAGRLNSLADLRFVEWIASSRGLRTLAKKASRERQRLGRSRASRTRQT